MDWRLVGTSFLAIFLAELGDKTQVATMSLAAGDDDKGAVLLGASAALVASSILAVLVGAAVSKVVSPQLLRRGAGVIFIVLGVLWVSGR